MKRKESRKAELRRLLLKLPVKERWVIIRRAKLKVLPGGKLDASKKKNLKGQFFKSVI